MLFSDSFAVSSRQFAVYSPPLPFPPHLGRGRGGVYVCPLCTCRFHRLIVVPDLMAQAAELPDEIAEGLELETLRQQGVEEGAVGFKGEVHCSPSISNIHRGFVKTIRQEPREYSYASSRHFPCKAIPGMLRDNHRQMKQVRYSRLV
jgi:hypothetical protein